MSLKLAESQVKRLNELAKELRQEVPTGLAAVEEDVERYLLTAQCIFALARLRAGAHGKSLKEYQPMDLETKRLRRYEEKVETALRQKRRAALTDEHALPTRRVLSHALWPDLTDDQKQQFNTLTKREAPESGSRGGQI